MIYDSFDLLIMCNIYTPHNSKSEQKEKNKYCARIYKKTNYKTATNTSKNEKIPDKFIPPVPNKQTNK